MNYYWMVQSTGDDIGKASSQVKGMKEGYDFYGPYSVRNLPYFKKPDFEPNFDALQVNNQAKVTDIIIPTGVMPRTGFFLSEKVKNILQHFIIPSHLFYQAPIIHRSKTYDNFYWIQFIEEMSDKIDFENSTFALKEAFGWQNWIDIENDLKFKNTTELRDFCKSTSSMKDIIPTILKMTIEADIICFSSFGNSFLVSEKIKNALDFHQIKGVEFIQF